jgi:D-aminopeptidase
MEHDEWNDSGFGGVFFIGYHAMAGTANAILAHTGPLKSLIGNQTDRRSVNSG